MKRQSIEALGGIPLDVDLTTPEHLLHAPAGLMPMQSAGRVLAEIGASVIEDMSQPAARAGFVSSLLTSMLCSKARLGFLPSVAIAVMVGVSVEHLYGMAEDIHASLAPPQLLFHGYGCPGHTTGMPAESCMADAPEPV